MSDAADKLALTRLAIIAHVQRRERRREKPRSGDESETEVDDDEWAEDAPSGGRRSWFAGFKRAGSTWWRHHPARMGLDMATPMLSAYAARKPLQYLGFAALLGAVLVVTRPWRLISLTGLLVALVKSSQLSSMVLSAMSAADYGKDQRPPL